MRRFACLIPQGEVLDLACGGGRHSLLLAKMGYGVIALDRDVESLKLLTGEPNITTLQCDLENGVDAAMPVWPFEANHFAGMVVTNYLHRPLFSQIVSSLAPDGVLIYETFAQGNEHFGKPSRPDFLLKRRELLDLATNYGLQVIAFEDGFIDTPKPAVVQRICCKKAGPNLAMDRIALNTNSSI